MWYLDDEPPNTRLERTAEKRGLMGIDSWPSFLPLVLVLLIAGFIPSLTAFVFGLNLPIRRTDRIQIAHTKRSRSAGVGTRQVVAFPIHR